MRDNLINATSYYLYAKSHSLAYPIEIKFKNMVQEKTSFILTWMIYIEIQDHLSVFHMHSKTGIRGTPPRGYFEMFKMNDISLTHIFLNIISIEISLTIEHLTHVCNFLI